MNSQEVLEAAAIGLMASASFIIILSVYIRRILVSQSGPWTNRLKVFLWTFVSGGFLIAASMFSILILVDLDDQFDFTGLLMVSPLLQILVTCILIALGLLFFVGCNLAVSWWEALEGFRYRDRT